MDADFPSPDASLPEDVPALQAESRCSHPGEGFSRKEDMFSGPMRMSTEQKASVSDQEIT